MAHSDLIMIGFNFVLCIAGLAMCIGRLKDMRASSTKMTIRVQYTIWTAYFSASLFMGTWVEPATITQVVLTGAVVVQLLLGFKVWRYGPPAYTRRSLYEMGD